jgi:hypothetical protein
MGYKAGDLVSKNKNTKNPSKSTICNTADDTEQQESSSSEMQRGEMSVSFL